MELTLLITFVPENENMTGKLKHGETSKQSILHAAKTLFLKQGYKATSIRKIASEMGISPTTIYLYYRDKAEIMHALHQEGFKMLSGKFQTLRNVGDPFERLKAMGRCYINFAMDNPDFYEIMFIMKEPLKHLGEGQSVQPGCPDPGWGEGEATFQTLITTVADCQEAGYFKGYDTRVLALLIWANMHGLCALQNNGHLELLANKTIGEDTDVSKVLQHSFDLYARILNKI